MLAIDLRETEPIKTSPAEDTCRACGACCLGEVDIILSRKEAKMMRSHGTTLKRKSFSGGRDENYRMESACSFLEIDSVDGLYSCSLYGQKERPRACLATVMEGSECEPIRAEVPFNLVEMIENDEPLDLGFGMLAA